MKRSGKSCRTIYSASLGVNKKFGSRRFLSGREDRMTSTSNNKSNKKARRLDGRSGSSDSLEPTRAAPLHPNSTKSEFDQATLRAWDEPRINFGACIAAVRPDERRSSSVSSTFSLRHTFEEDMLT